MYLSVSPKMSDTNVECFTIVDNDDNDGKLMFINISCIYFCVYNIFVLLLCFITDVQVLSSSPSNPLDVHLDVFSSIDWAEVEDERTKNECDRIGKDMCEKIEETCFSFDVQVRRILKI